MSSTGINSLAPEILSYIFEFRQQDVVDDGRMLLDLAGVCKYWKEAAFGHPQLWCSIHCALTRSSQQGVVDGLERWFGRAGQLPLSLHVNIIRWPYLPEQGTPMAEFIASCSAWDTLEFMANNEERDGYEPDSDSAWHWMAEILREGERRSKFLQAPCWPVLRTLEISADYRSLFGSVPLPTQDLAPGIQSLNINCPMLYAPDYLCKGMVRQKFSWSTLSSFCLSNVCDLDARPTFLLDILRCAVNLERMEVLRRTPNIRGHYRRHDSEEDTVTHHKLKHLSLELQGGLLKGFFQRTRFPALRSMKLRTKGEPKLYSWFLRCSLEDECKDPEFWPNLEHFILMLGDNVLEVREGDPGFPIFKQGPWTWYILAGTPYGMS